MDNQTPTPKPVPTEAEIARLEAEAVARLQRGEPLSGREDAPEAAAPPDAPPVRPDFVPYVDDVPEPEPAPRKAESEAEVEDEDEDDGEYIPSEMEKRIDAMTPQQWKLWQILGGVAVGAAVIAALFLLGQELSAYALILAAVLAILLPRYLERAWQRKLTVARYAMVATMVVGLIIAFIVIGTRTGFVFTKAD